MTCSPQVSKSLITHHALQIGFIRGTDTALLSHGESLSSPGTFPFDRKRLHQHRQSTCLLSLAGCCAAHET